MNWVGLLLVLSAVYGVSLECSVTDVKSLLEGCDNLSGLVVTNGQGTTINDHNCGELQPVLAFAEEPHFQYPSADSEKKYTLLFVDPDVPLHNEGEFFLHMMKTNIPGSDLKVQGKARTTGCDSKVYLPPSPPPGTGAHRYTSLLYEQVNEDGPNAPLLRVKFDLADWLRGTNLCGPVASSMSRMEINAADPVQSLI